MADRTIVELVIISNLLTPEDITRMVGIPPDSQWRMGETRPRTRMVERTHGWVVRASASESVPLDVQVQHLLARATPCAHRIRTLTDQARIIFKCTIFTDSRPPLFFSNEVLRRITAFGADLDIDAYVWESETDVPSG